MGKLLSANFARLRRDRLFWGLVTGMILLGAYTVLHRWWIYWDLQPDRLSQARLSWFEFFAFMQYIGPAMAVLTAFFQGTEHSDGTLRTKLVVGCTRWEVYLAFFVSVAGTALVLALVCIAVVLVLGIPLLGPPRLENVPYLLEGLIGSLATCLAFSAVFTVVGMNCSRSAHAAVICLVGLIAAEWLVNYLVSALHAPAFNAFQNWDPVLGMYTETTIPNPEYVGGLRRTLYQFLYEFLPSGQASQYAAMDSMHPSRMAVYAVLFSGLSTMAGFQLFRRKDLR